MFSKFNLKLNENDYARCYDVGKKMYEALRKEYKGAIADFTDEKGVVNGVELQEKWFPTNRKYDIFLSHSHKDEALAIALAGYLKQECGLRVFIDSCLWGYSNDLLKRIDQTYCRSESGNTYDYDKRNYTTSHVHMMLNIALNQMMDKCESIFFLNTENSINVVDDMESEKTMSPWIYSELNLAKVIAIRDLDEYRINCKKRWMNEHSVLYFMLESEEESLEVSYDVTGLVAGFIEITKDDLHVMAQSNKRYPLDQLYECKDVISMKVCRQ